MDDARIQSLRQEVLSQLQEGPATESDRTGLLARVAALEDAVGQLAARLGPGGAAVPAVSAGGSVHPSFQVFTLVGPSSDRCVMEPDKPCVKSHACRTFGY
jgi:hypothetical protein